MSENGLHWSVGREIPVPPEGFVHELAVFDPALRLRWGVQSQCWLIERLITRAKAVDPGRFRGPTRFDDYCAARDGYDRVLRIKPYRPSCEDENEAGVPLDARIFIHLVRGDVWRYGGETRYLELLERLEESEEEDRRRQADGEIHDAGKEMWNELQWDFGNRRAMRTPKVRPREHPARFYKVYA